jgi:hypothetical protein
MSVDELDAVRRRVILTPANSPEKAAALDALYEAVVGPPPDGSKPLPRVMA